MRYKGKRVRVRDYKLFTTDQLIKEVEGKCIKSHQGGPSIRDTNYFIVRDDSGKEHYFDGNFSIEIIEEETKQMKKDKTIQGIRRRELTVRKQILSKEIEDLEEYLNQSAPDEDTQYFERVIREKKEQLSKMERGWLDYLNRLTMEVK